MKRQREKSRWGQEVFVRNRRRNLDSARLGTPRGEVAFNSMIDVGRLPKARRAGRGAAKQYALMGTFLKGHPIAELAEALDSAKPRSRCAIGFNCRRRTSRRDLPGMPENRQRGRFRPRRNVHRMHRKRKRRVAVSARMGQTSRSASHCRISTWRIRILLSAG
jgi:hypothetical protein